MTDQLDLRPPEVAEAPKRVTARDVCAHLAMTYTEADGYACLFEVADGTGGGPHTRADALVMSLWKSHGLQLTGYEIKVARSDWLNELKNPAKAWPVMQYCDRWVLLAAPGVAKVEEIPTNWGFHEFGGARVRVVKPAPVLEAKAITRTFLASMVRRPVRDIDAQVAAAVRKQIAEYEKQFDAKVRDASTHRAQEADTVLKKARELKEATGIDLLHGYEEVANVAGAIKRAMATNPMHSWRGLPGAIDRVEQALRTLKELQTNIQEES